ncbi:hypothetical protein ABB37_02188 [Leptomonas pyrrhocoris]|uniref:Uncharacterized protein n=1 Tax=Leptomonas pyrrhocoris TaxID=157538 RepID=A0A0M9G7N7_LEPPY|nr:hypothetical protein ABB37_02188 [Leptomonas pyrrhocoris]XP_015662519.1 hypothetical protein ABB37_02188 [Leptomonas pyrrhocoris]KPA84079.1 hypothetical protein ABB37_02188 [Leptomonas pyrrhocoris]KPA84080.1 hypothetical protein ABB37_02188 [Leptomonas pyrrhocoris]|eukprot:XP_015662518.1 hypothetical protein ABB37_02188 [Leptomonas pyrrhocoris]
MRCRPSSPYPDESYSSSCEESTTSDAAPHDSSSTVWCAASNDSRAALAAQLLSQLGASEQKAYSTFCEATTAMLQLRMVLMHVKEVTLVVSLDQAHEAEDE